MLSALIASPTLELQLAEEMLYLSPGENLDEPTQDSVINGTATLYLPKARIIKSISVVLNGRIDIGFPAYTRPYESSNSLEREVNLLNDEELSLEKGSHIFQFSIVVPSSTAPYERCQWGRVRHYIAAKAKGNSLLGNGIIAQTEEELFLIVNPGGAGQSVAPPALDLKVPCLDDELGSYTFTLQSQNITVAVKIFQKVLLKSQIDGEIVEVPPDPRTVFRLDQHTRPNNGIPSTSRTGESGSRTPISGVPLQILEVEESWKFMHLARLPNDNVLRSSTQPGTITGIVVSHDVAVEITFQKGNLEEIHKIIVTKPLNLHSCCCVADSLELPIYTIIDTNPNPDFSPPCICMMNLEQLIKSQGDTLGREEGETGIYFPGFKNDSGASTPASTEPNRGRVGLSIFRNLSFEDRE